LLKTMQTLIEYFVATYTIKHHKEEKMLGILISSTSSDFSDFVFFFTTLKKWGVLPLSEDPTFNLIQFKLFRMS